MDPHDFLGSFLGHLFDVHAAGGARHDDRPAGRAIENDAEIQLALHLKAFFNQHPANHAPSGSGLMRDERHPEHVARDAFGLVCRARQLDAAAFAATAGMNLRLDHHRTSVTAEALRDLARRRRLERDFTARHRDTVAREDRFPLVLVDLHSARCCTIKLLMLTCASLRRNCKLLC